MSTKVVMAAKAKKRKKITLLTVSDVQSRRIYDAKIKERFSKVNLVLSCGDLPNYYLDFIMSMLNVPMLFVHGNHVNFNSGDPEKKTQPPLGARNLHRKVVYLHNYDLIIAGIEGSLRYNKNAHQYSQLEMWLLVFSMIPRLLWNRLIRGRYLDVFMSHAPAWQINDDNDLAHQGIKAFRWLIEVFKPQVFVHGHVHTYRDQPKKADFYRQTRVYNTCGYQLIDIEDGD